MIDESDFINVTVIGSGTIYKRRDGILIFKQASGRDSVTVAELEEQHEAFMNIQKGSRSPLVVIVEKLKKLDNEEKMFLASKIPLFADKFCIVTTSVIPTFIFNVFIFLNRPAIPGKIFHTVEEAIEWIKKTNEKI